MPPKPPVKQITKLTQIDISKLDVKDLQNIDYQKILTDIRQKPDTIIIVIVPLLAIFVSFHVYTKAQGQLRTNSAKIYELTEKQKVYDQYMTFQSDLQKYLNSLPNKINENEFINKITDLAVKNNIQIETISPSSNKDDANSIFDQNSLELMASADDFNDIGMFIKEIEQSDASIRVNSWSASMGSGKRETRSNNDMSGKNGQVINFRVNISLITFR